MATPTTRDTAYLTVAFIVTSHLRLRSMFWASCFTRERIKLCIVRVHFMYNWELFV